jgi:hypothetical protein
MGAVGMVCTKYMDDNMRNLPCQRIQVDEIIAHDAYGVQIHSFRCSAKLEHDVALDPQQSRSIHPPRRNPTHGP